MKLFAFPIVLQPKLTFIQATHGDEQCPLTCALCAACLFTVCSILFFYSFCLQTYVQDLIEQEFDSLYNLIVLQRGHVYVCGDVTMAEHVYQTIRWVTRVGEELFSLIAFVLLALLLLFCCWLLAWAWSNGGCCSWGNCSFQMVCGLFCHRFAAALLSSHSLSLSYAWLRALLWNMRRERERGKSGTTYEQQTTYCCPISIH